jgi:hypothetical protein
MKPNCLFFLSRWYKVLIPCVAWGAVLGMWPAYALDVSHVDVEAAAQTFGFLEGLQHRSSVVVDIAYKAGDADSKALAQRIATIFAEQSGPHSSIIVAGAISTVELTQNPRRMDVLYILPGMGEAGRGIGDYVRHQHILSISNDPACLSAQCCVLMVRGADGNIVMDSGLARDADTKFAAVFTMMVKRK